MVLDVVGGKKVGEGRRNNVYGGRSHLPDWESTIHGTANPVEEGIPSHPLDQYVY
jgi:hypothetical protein